MISIAIRAHNRLEYTIQCLNGICANPPKSKYEIVLINQGSQDGTKEWLDWVQTDPMAKKWFKHIKVCNLPRNLGDWGGMEYAFTQLDPEAKYVCQIDNDIVVEPEFFTYARSLLLGNYAAVVMAKRLGVSTTIEPSKTRTIAINGKSVEVGLIHIATACWMTKVSYVKKASKALNNTREFTESLASRFKLMNTFCTQLDGPMASNNFEYIQRIKYAPSEKFK